MFDLGQLDSCRKCLFSNLVCFHTDLDTDCCHPLSCASAYQVLNFAHHAGKDGEITTTHLLLGIWSEKESAGHKILASLGFNDEKANELAKSVSALFQSTSNYQVYQNYL